MQRRHFCALVVGSAALVFAVSAQPQEPAFPSRAITWVVPFPPGGITDVTSRALAKKMAEILGQQIVIDNRPGAGGSLGTQQVARAAPDGYTVLLVTSGTMAANPLVYEGLAYEPLRDFIPVHGMFLSAPLLLVASESPFDSVAKLVAAAKADPGVITFGSAGIGTSTHLAAELFKSTAGINMLHVPYRGTAPALQDLLGGRIDLMFDYVGVALPHINARRLRALAVMTDTRLPVLPLVPTIVEVGHPSAQISAWSGLAVPAATPSDVVKKLSEAMRAALQDPETISYFVAAGSQPLVEVDEMQLRGLIVDEQKRAERLLRRIQRATN